MKQVIVAVLGLLPASKVKNVLLRRNGWHIASGVSVGPGVYMKIGAVHLGRGVRIGPFNVIRDLSTLRIDDFGKISQWNWISASLPIRMAGGHGSLTIGTHSSLTSRHYVDCSGGVELGNYTTVAGMRSTFLTHGISWKDGRQTFDTIAVGDYCLISSNVSVAPGVRIGERVVVGMGATISGDLLEPGLYVQPRATLVKADLTGAYFDRELGAIAEIRSRR